MLSGVLHSDRAIGMNITLADQWEFSPQMDADGFADFRRKTWKILHPQ